MQKEISNIIKNHLSVQNNVKPIRSIFLNERYSKKIKLNPYFQRNYVWKEDKATYFIESILYGTEIPPIILFNNGNSKDIIDGRQRYETIQKFLSNKLALSSKGLKLYTHLANKKFDDLTLDMKNNLKDQTIRIIEYKVINEPKLSGKREDKIKKEIFKRYNTGIVSLQRQEIERAEYIDDSFTIKLNKELERNDKLFRKIAEMFFPKSILNKQHRDQVNYIAGIVRGVVILPHVSIKKYSYAKLEEKAELYNYICSKYSDTVILNNVKKTINELYRIKMVLEREKHII